MVKSLSSALTSSAGIDPTLDALFTSSAGPAKFTQSASKAPRQKAKHAPESSEDDEEDESGSSSSSAEDQDDADSDVAIGNPDDESGSESETAEDSPSTESPAQAPTESHRAERKRKRKDPTEEIERAHLQKLWEGDNERSSKRKKGDEPSEGGADEAAENDSEEEDDDDDSDGGVKIVHESLAQEAKDTDLDKADRTVFLANVSTEAISSKKAKKTLEKHLQSILDKSATPPEKLESIRFRSLAFSTLALPKRAAYITKSLMDTTTKSCNAYAVYSTPAAARKAATKLNATQVLDRHIRVDGVKHPSPTDHRRCVFVGNLGFVDDETVMNTDAEGNTTSKKRYKIPSDIEEGLWRVFTQKAGKVESVRVIRDPQTRVGKGFAYVQFYDANHVEAALLLDGKKFAPMLPRPLRVTRARNPKNTAQALQKRGIRPNSATATGNTQAKFGNREKGGNRRDTKLLGVAGAARRATGTKAHGDKGLKTPEHVIFEGKRAAAGDADLLGKRYKSKKSATGKRLKGKRAQRAKEWKKGGGKKTE